MWAETALYALDGATGEQKWQCYTGWPFQFAPVIGPDGTIYASCGPYLCAVDGVNSKLKWTYKPAAYHLATLPESRPAQGKNEAQSIWVYSAPFIGADNTVFVVSGDGALRALNPTNGKPKWTFQAPCNGGDLSGLRATLDGSLLLAWIHKLYAIDMATGSLRWRVDTGNTQCGSAPAIGPDGTIYVGTVEKAGGRLLALDSATGTIKWSFETGYIICSPAIGIDGTVYFGSFNHNFYAVDGTTGKEKWHVSTGDAIQASPAIRPDGTVVFGSYDHKLYVVDGATGAVQWSEDLGAPIQASPAVGRDGTVYVGTLDGRFYALHRD